MPILFRNISANILDHFVSEVVIFKPIIGQVQGEDYINMNGFIAYLQDFTRAEYTKCLIKPTLFGLQKTNNSEEYTIEISY